MHKPTVKHEIKQVKRANQNPTRFRQFLLWFKPSWKMTFEEYADHYHRLNPRVRETLRRMSADQKMEQKRFAYMIKNYGKIYGPEDNIIDHTAMVRGLRALNIQPGAKIVSYGAGFMHHEAFLLKEFPQIGSMIGIEPLKGMREVTKKIAINILGLRRASKMKNLNGTFENSPIMKGSADVVISNEAFHHVKQPEDALKNLVSKLGANGGMVLIYRPDYKTNPPKPEQIAKILAGEGMTIVTSEKTRTDPDEPNNNIHLLVAKKHGRQ